jgi:predicted alpha/beta superfamily hydrolase
MNEWREYRREAGGTQQAPEGRVQVLERLHSPELGNDRAILVHLPPSYDRSPRRYPVVYMHDGQNLFDAETSFAGAWGVDRTLEEASREGLEALVVGIPHAGEGRLDEYSPWRDRRHDAGGRGGAYVEFIARTLKPLVDRDFRTLPGRETTAVAGSSMGGLISLYAFLRRPDVFGAAGVMSPALWFGGRSIFPFVSGRPFTPGRIYLDVGTSEGREVLPDVRRMRELLARKGYRSGRELMYVVEMGGRHEERAWGRRLGRALRFLLGAPPRPGAPAARRVEPF